MSKYLEYSGPRIVRLHFSSANQSRCCEIELLSKVSEFYNNRRVLPVCSCHRVVHKKLLLCSGYNVSGYTLNLFFNLLVGLQSVLSQADNLIELVHFCGFLLCKESFLFNLFLVSSEFSTLYSNP